MKLDDSHGVHNHEYDQPKDIIRQRQYQIISTEEMMDKLINYEYTYGFVPYNTDAYIAGTWDQIELAFFRGQITKEEFATLFKAKRAEIYKETF